MSVLAFVRPSKVARLLKMDEDPLAPMSQNSLNGFGDAIVSITGYCNAVRNLDLLPPLPGNVPDWYAPLNTNLQNMKGHGQIWIDRIGPSMTAIPQAIINFNNTFEGQYDTIMGVLKEIGINPPTPQQKQNLLTLMNALLAAMTAEQTAISGANTSLIQFNDNLSNDHTQLTTGAASVTAAIQYDKADVDAMKKKVQALQIAMDALHQEVTWAAAGIGIGLFVGLVGVFLAIATFGAGVPIAVVGFAGAVASVGVLIAAEVQIQQDAQAIAEANVEMSTDNQQIVVLNSVASTVDLLVTKNAAAGQAMNVVLTDWATLTVKVQGVINDLEKAEGDIGSILDAGDMESARLAWQQLSAFAQNMQYGLANVTADPKIVAINTNKRSAA